MFYVDIEADAESEAFKPILDMIKDKTDYLKILGSYRTRGVLGCRTSSSGAIRS